LTHSLGQHTNRITDNFNRLYYDSRIWEHTYWLGTPALKCPMDLWVYQELIVEVRPDVIVECGTWDGGSAMFLASICNLLKHGRIVTIDIDPREHRPKHKRVKYITGSSVAPDVIETVLRQINRKDRVLVILDSDHSKTHVLSEMRAYAPLVTVGSYLIVEDTNINGHPVYPEFGPGPMEALEEFLAERDDFEIDPSREKFVVTFNPKGWLRRVR